MKYRRSHPLVSGVPPAWATCWGDSIYGPWAGFMEDNIVYKMFWIAPGHFTMGSPETEVGREDRDQYKAYFETPHEVTLTEGFWMAEWPCPQRLWTTVMGDNPSQFQHPWRPVERVSWEDTKAFLEKLNARHAGLHARLPTEAEWEYACRAGTKEATYAGDLEILGARNAPVLDEIAWYGGNSGIEFDLKSGHDASDWPNKQYDFEQAGTRRVAMRKPNAWGLRDMLGNVNEWCQDWHAPYSSEAQRDPTGPSGGGLRVIRGGSWNALARDCRAAHRDALEPSYRYHNLGFRFCRGQGAPSR